MTDEQSTAIDQIEQFTLVSAFGGLGGAVMSNGDPALWPIAAGAGAGIGLVAAYAQVRLTDPGVEAA
jgi:hypothetical protein